MKRSRVGPGPSGGEGAKVGVGSDLLAAWKVCPSRFTVPTTRVLLEQDVGTTP